VVAGIGRPVLLPGGSAADPDGHAGGHGRRRPFSDRSALFRPAWPAGGLLQQRLSGRTRRRGAGKYDKAHLVPYGEYTPFKEYLPFLGKIVEHVGDFKPGIQGQTLDMQGRKLGVQICYEIIFPALARAMVQNGAGLLITITNDAWYGTTAGPYQHFSLAVLRAVENRRALARAANTGISGFIDPAGRVLERTPLMKEAAVVRELPLLETTAVYTRWGDIFAASCLIGSIVSAAWELLRHRQSRFKIKCDVLSKKRNSCIC